MPKLASMERKLEYVKPFVLSMQLGGRRFFVTISGRIGLVHISCRKMRRADMPFILRSVGGCYGLIGLAYVRGLMNGGGLMFKTLDELMQAMVNFTIM
jgi:hypothetical protein